MPEAPFYLVDGVMIFSDSEPPSNLSSTCEIMIFFDSKPPSDLSCTYVFHVGLSEAVYM